MATLREDLEQLIRWTSTADSAYVIGGNVVVRGDLLRNIPDQLRYLLEDHCGDAKTEWGVSPTRSPAHVVPVSSKEEAERLRSKHGDVVWSRRKQEPWELNN